jgi:antitoxin component YwqK of YwqJK toxin-antitoxin module
MKNLENLFNTSFIYLFFVVAIFIQSCGQNCLDSETFREKREMVAIDETYGKEIYRTKIDGEFYTGNECDRMGNMIATYNDGYKVESYSYSDDRLDGRRTYIMGVEVSDTNWGFDDNGKRYLRSYITYSSENWEKDGVYLMMWGPDQINFKRTYKNGIIVSDSEEYYENGNRKEISFYNDNGKQDGFCKRWFEDGTLNRVIFFENGFIKDEWQWLNPYSGKSMWVKTKENGKSTRINLDNDGKLEKYSSVPLTKGVYIFPEFTKENLKDFDPAG